MPIDQELLLKKASELEPLPQTAAKLTQIMSHGDYEMQEVLEVIQYDPALTIRFLKLANSPVYRGQAEVGTVEQALLRLGAIEAVSVLTLFGVRFNLDKASPSYGLSAGELWRHSVATAVLAQSLAHTSPRVIPPESFTTALIHDIGKLLLGEFISFEDLSLLQQAWQQGELLPVDAESQILGVHHGEVGGVIAQNWNFPETMVKAIIYHHHPQEHPTPLTDAVYLSNNLAKFLTDSAGVLPEGWSCQDEVLQRLEVTPEKCRDLLSSSLEKFNGLMALYGDLE